MTADHQACSYNGADRVIHCIIHYRYCTQIRVSGPSIITVCVVLSSIAFDDVLACTLHWIMLMFILLLFQSVRSISVNITLMATLAKVISFCVNMLFSVIQNIMLCI